MDRRQGSRPRPWQEEEGGKREVDDRKPWLKLFDDLGEPECTEAVADRAEELLWILDHLDDLDADFLAIYGIDLEQVEISARRYFALTYRLTAYSGVMAAVAEEERGDRPASSTSTRTSTTAPPPRQGNAETTEVSLTQFRAQFPGWVSVAQGG